MIVAVYDADPAGPVAVTVTIVLPIDERVYALLPLAGKIAPGSVDMDTLVASVDDQDRVVS